MDRHDVKRDAELTPDQLKLIAKLTDAEVLAIDDALLSNTSHTWRKVAMVVGSTMMELHGRIEGIPDVYYSQRVKKLVEDGLLEAQGDLSFMRYSEVRRIHKHTTTCFQPEDK